MKSKRALETLAITTHIVLPNDTNTLGNLFGGQLLAWMDVIASVSAHRHCKRVVVTASVNHVSFQKPIKHASIVTLEAKVSRSFNSSMEIFVDVFVEDQVTGEKEKCNEAIYTFVAVDQNGGPIQVPELIPETEEEKSRFEGALRRKQLSLILAGKMKPSEATELRKIFLEGN
ncbi:MAG: acyl-CoA thioesterase [Crocinitomicaceae bacterium]|jgi:acyl-CoA hydrolase